MPNYTVVITFPDPTQSWALLTSGVPISLLCDLAFMDGPPSRAILTCEGLEDDVARSHPRGRSIELPEVTISTA